MPSVNDIYNQQVIFKARRLNAYFAGKLQIGMQVLHASERGYRLTSEQLSKGEFVLISPSFIHSKGFTLSSRLQAFT